MPDSIPIYDGAIRANRVGSFIKGGEGFDVIRPGYDSQGRRRNQWTQVVHAGVPIYTQKVQTPVEDFLARFDMLWERWIGDDKTLLARALTSTKKDHVRRFKDGVTGEAPSPSLTHDGREQGKQYPA